MSMFTLLQILGGIYITFKKVKVTLGTAFINYDKQ